MNGGEGKTEVERKEKVVSKMQKTWADTESLKEVSLKLTYGCFRGKRKMVQGTEQ